MPSNFWQINIGSDVLHENDVKKLNEEFCIIENERFMLRGGGRRCKHMYTAKPRLLLANNRSLKL